MAQRTGGSFFSMGEGKRKRRAHAAVLEGCPWCIYCADVPATTVDHVPPIIMFAQRQRPKVLSSGVAKLAMAAPSTLIWSRLWSACHAQFKNGGGPRGDEERLFGNQQQHSRASGGNVLVSRSNNRLQDGPSKMEACFAAMGRWSRLTCKPSRSRSDLLSTMK